MATKKSQELTFADIVMGARADLIKQAYEARLKIDEQLAAREEAYRRIAELEQQIEEIVGMPGQFVYPAPPLPVAGVSSPSETRRTFDKPSKTSQKSGAASQTNKRAEEPPSVAAAHEASTATEDVPETAGESPAEPEDDASSQPAS